MLSPLLLGGATLNAEYILELSSHFMNTVMKGHNFASTKSACNFMHKDLDMNMMSATQMLNPGECFMFYGTARANRVACGLHIETGAVIDGVDVVWCLLCTQPGLHMRRHVAKMTYTATNEHNEPLYKDVSLPEIRALHNEQKGEGSYVYFWARHDSGCTYLNKQCLGIV